MVLLFLIPIFFDGPGVIDYYETYKRQFALDWYAVLLQFRNLQTHRDIPVSLSALDSGTDRNDPILSDPSESGVASDNTDFVTPNHDTVVSMRGCEKR